MSRLAELVDLFKGRRVVVLGDFVADLFVYGEISRISREAPVLVLKHRETQLVPGGGANAVHNIRALGAHPIPVGVVGAMMNSTGNLAAMLSPLLVAYSVQWFGSWNVPLYLMGVLFLVGAFCWTLVDPSRPVFDELPMSSPDRAASNIGAATASAGSRP